MVELFAGTNGNPRKAERREMLRGGLIYGRR
jgi:hypothetical protein